MTNKDLESRFMGAMVGSALGDAIGEVAFGIHEEGSLRSLNRKTCSFTRTTRPWLWA